jgi:iron complex transport system substrate-binding protein
LGSSDLGTAEAAPSASRTAPAKSRNGGHPFGGAGRGALALACTFIALATLHAAAPMRIVSTSPSITETLFALGLGDRVVGVSRFCRYPDSVRALPKVGTFLKPDAELVAQLKPDLVIIHAGPHEIARQMSVLRIPHITVDRGSLPGAYTTIRAIGAAAGVPDRAQALVSKIDAHLAAIRALVAGRTPKRVLLLVGRRAGSLTDLVAVGRDTYLNDIVTIAGGVNVLADQGLPEYPNISMETVIRLAPDVIVDGGDMGDTPEDKRRRAESTLRIWSQSTVDAARAGRVHPVISDAFVVPGPRVTEVADTLAEWFHGVRLP